MLGRRKLVTGALAAAFLPKAAGAVVCNDWMAGAYVSARTCRVGLSRVIPFAEQKREQWCWAASISGLFRQHGYVVSQQRIVTAIYGDNFNLPAWGPQIAAATSRQWTTDDGHKTFEAECEVLMDADYLFFQSDAVQQAAQELDDGNPLVIGCISHAMVLTGMSYTGFSNGQFRIDSVTVRDPWPGRGKRLLFPNEWQGTRFLARVTTLG